MTDAEIKKALRCCALNKLSNNTCDDCLYGNKVFRCGRYCNSVLSDDALDLINRQQADKEALIAGQETLQKALAEKIAEIERLNSDLRVWNDIAHRETEYVEIAKAEAIKEFAEQLKKQMKDLTRWQAGSHTYYVIGTEFIDNLVKEMVGDAE